MFLIQSVLQVQCREEVTLVESGHALARGVVPVADPLLGVFADKQILYGVVFYFGESCYDAVAGVVVVLGLGIPLNAYQAVSYALGIQERGGRVDVADDRIDVAQVVVETERVVVTGLVLVGGSEDESALLAEAERGLDLGYDFLLREFSIVSHGLLAVQLEKGQGTVLAFAVH